MDYNSRLKAEATKVFIAIDKIIYVRANTSNKNKAVIGCIAFSLKSYEDCEQNAHLFKTFDNHFLDGTYSGRVIYSLVSYHVLESVEAVMESIQAERELMRMIHG
mgnify:CR=1 FL=1